MTGDPMRDKALQRLRGSLVMVVDAYTPPHGAHRPTRIMARVASTRPGVSSHVVDYDRELGWRCTCRPGLRGEACYHVLAVQMVTGHAPS